MFTSESSQPFLSCFFLSFHLFSCSLVSFVDFIITCLSSCCLHSSLQSLVVWLPVSLVLTLPLRQTCGVCRTHVPVLSCHLSILKSFVPLLPFRQGCMCLRPHDNNIKSFSLSWIMTQRLANLLTLFHHQPVSLTGICFLRRRFDSNRKRRKNQITSVVSTLPWKQQSSIQVI